MTINIRRAWPLVSVISCFVSFSSLAAVPCRTALERLENSRLKMAVEFSANSRPAELHGFPLHLANNPILPFIWLTHPEHGSEYFVVRKNDTGFGFSGPKSGRFNLINDDSINLRSLDFTGDAQNLVATLVAKDETTGNLSVVMKLASIANQDTGELQLLGTPGLEIQGIQNIDEHMIVSPRPKTKEFWMTDGSTIIRGIEIESSGQPVLEFSIDLAEHHVSLISKVQFFEDGNRGYIRLKRTDASWAIVPFVLSTPPAPAKAKKTKKADPRDDGLQLSIAWNEAHLIEPDYVRTTAHPSEPIVVVAYRDRIEAIGLNIESQTFTKVLDQKIDFLSSDQEILGIEYYWNGALKKIKTAEGPQTTFVGQVEAALLVGKNQRQSTLVYWLNLKGN